MDLMFPSFVYSWHRLSVFSLNATKVRVSDVLGRAALTLGARFKEARPQILAFLEYCEGIPRRDAGNCLGSPDVQARLNDLDPLGLRILAEVLDEVRIKGETEHLYREAAFWDLIADRVKDELSLRKL
jgi:hypothetical protein